MSISMIVTWVKEMVFFYWYSCYFYYREFECYHHYSYYNY